MLNLYLNNFLFIFDNKAFKLEHFIEGCIGLNIIGW